MLIKLDTSLIDYCDLKSETPKKIDFFEHVADIRARGFHFILADRKLLELLGSLKKLSKRSRKIYQKLFQNYTTESAIESSLEFVYVIGNFHSSVSSTNIMLNIEELNGNTFLNRNKLLLENSSDDTIYGIIVNYYLKSKSLESLNYEWELCNGGGSTSYAEYSRIIKEKLTYTFCILDSDKISPYDNLGATAQQFEDNAMQSCFGNYYILPVHEMENLYPEEMISALAHSDMCYSKHRAVVEKFKKDKTCDALHYADLKKGLNKYTLHNLKEKCKEYWKKFLIKHGYDIKKCDCSDSSCPHYFIAPFGRKINQNIIGYANKIDLKIEELLDSVYEILWINIGKILLERYCCPTIMVNV